MPKRKLTPAEFHERFTAPVSDLETISDELRALLPECTSKQRATALDLIERIDGTVEAMMEISSEGA